MKKMAALLLALVLCTGVHGEELVALTFDDGPTGELTGELLDGLEEREVRATFFLCGYRVEQFPSLTDRIAAEGHEIGIHGMTHDYLHCKPREVIAGELEGSAALAEAHSGERPVLFRPPGGLVSQRLIQEARAAGLSLILWNVDPEDWNTRDAATVVRRVADKAKDGDIILMHDMSRSSVRAALEIIDQLTAKGFRFCTVSELAALRGVEPEPGERYFNFPA